MNKRPKIARPEVTCLFLDIGGVLLTNGWDHVIRRRAAKHFHLDWAEMEEQHRLNFELHERGRITLDEYLDRVVFGRKRPFSRAEFRRFMFAQSRPCPGMLAFIRQLKGRHGLKVVVVSNEGRELNAHRVRQFRLDDFTDIFVSSSFVGLRKPDADMFRLARDLALVPARQIVYLENTPLFIQVAEREGIRGVLHEDYRSTRRQLAVLGLSLEEGTGHANI